MALMSLGIDPYSGTSVDYIKKITDSFDGTQVGDQSLISDDIFALIVLSHAGYVGDEEIILKIISHIILNQSLDGSWGSVDMTSASIQALSNFEDLNGVSESISKGEFYLKEEQKSDGSFGNSSSTSWAIQSLLLDKSFDFEINNGIKYLTNQQQSDGGLDLGEIQSRVWVTSYALPAVLKLSWNDILEFFPKKENITITKKDKIEATSTKIIKTENISKKIEKPNKQGQVETIDNLLSASAGDAIQNQEAKSSLIKRVFKNFWEWLVSLI